MAFAREEVSLGRGVGMVKGPEEVLIAKGGCGVDV